MGRPRAYALEGPKNIPAMEAYRQGENQLTGLSKHGCGKPGGFEWRHHIGCLRCAWREILQYSSNALKTKVYGALHPHRVALISAQAERLRAAQCDCGTA